jgi:hypothetical protein
MDRHVDGEQLRDVVVSSQTGTNPEAPWIMLSSPLGLNITVAEVVRDLTAVFQLAARDRLAVDHGRRRARLGPPALGRPSARHRESSGTRTAAPTLDHVAGDLGEELDLVHSGKLPRKLGRAGDVFPQWQRHGDDRRPGWSGFLRGRRHMPL